MIKYKVIEGKNYRTERPMYFANVASLTSVGIKTLADEIAEKCTVTPHDIRAVVSALEEQIIRHLQNGQSVRLGQLGSFCPTIRSKSTNTAEEFGIGNIKSVGVKFSQSSTMRYKLRVSNPDITFSLDEPAA